MSKNTTPDFHPDTVKAIETLSTIEPKYEDGKYVFPKDTYGKLLTGNITPELADELANHHTAVVAAFHHYSGEKLAIEAFKKNPELDRVEAHLDLNGKDTLDIAYTRVKEGNAAGTPYTKYCASTVDYTVHAAGTSRGDLKLSRNALAANAQAAYGS